MEATLNSKTLTDMKEFRLTKEELKTKVENRYGAWIGIEFDCIKHTFGFSRVPGEALMLAQLLQPSKSEEELQMAPDHEIHDNIQSWCRENGIEFRRSYITDIYEFQSNRQRDYMLSIIKTKMQAGYPKFRARPHTVVLHIEVARCLYESAFMLSSAACAQPSANLRIKIMGLEVIEAVNVDKDYVELIY
jgi:hypothetical protein